MNWHQIAGRKSLTLTFHGSNSQLTLEGGNHHGVNVTKYNLDHSEIGSHAKASVTIRN